MEIEIASLLAILIVLVFLATVDTAFAKMSDVSLRRLAADAEEANKTATASLLRQILEDRSRFRFVLSSAIQVLLIGFTVLITLLIKLFVENNSKLLVLALLFALASTVIFRQILPRLFVTNNTEPKLLFLLPLVRPPHWQCVAQPFVTVVAVIDVDLLRRGPSRSRFLTRKPNEEDYRQTEI